MQEPPDPAVTFEVHVCHWGQSCSLTFLPLFDSVAARTQCSQEAAVWSQCELERCHNLSQREELKCRNGHQCPENHLPFQLKADRKGPAFCDGLWAHTGNSAQCYFGQKCCWQLCVGFRPLGSEVVLHIHCWWCSIVWKIHVNLLNRLCFVLVCLSHCSLICWRGFYYHSLKEWFRALTIWALNQRSPFSKPYLSCSDTDKCAARPVFRGSCSSLNCSGFPRSWNVMPRQLAIRKWTAISWWKAKDRACELSVLFLLW